MRLILSILIIAIAAPPPASADAGVAIFDPAPGADTAAMGMTGTAGGTRTAGALLNPAVVAGRHGVAINSAYANWSGDVDHFVNSFSWAGPVGSVTLGGALTHSRLEFKTFEQAQGYLPNNTQSSYMTATTAARWTGTHGAVAAGASAVWNTSEVGGNETRVDAGFLIEGPPTGGAGWSVRYALGFSALRGGAESTAPAGDHGFAPGSGAESFRYGFMLAVDSRIASTTIQGDLIDTARDGHTDATAAGIEVSLLEAIHLRAGYGDDIIGGRSATTLGAGAGYHIGDVTIRLDYARVKTTDNALAANIFGARLALDF